MLGFCLLSVSSQISCQLANMQFFCAFADVLLLISVVIISVSRWNILCSSKLVIDALDNPTVFCTVQGECK